MLTDTERSVAQTLGEAIQLLPREKQEYLIGYAEGVMAMAQRQEEADKKAG